MNHTHETAPKKVVRASGQHCAYRRFGKAGGVPIVFLQHFRGTMDNWDPAITNALAKDHEVILFNNAGVGGSSGALLATSALAQSAASLVVPIENEPAPRLFVEPPLPGLLASGVAFIPQRVENLRILPVGGPAARNLSPRVGHPHITVDDLPWRWSDYGQGNTIILVNLPRGEHNVLIEVVDPEGGAFTAQTVTFKSPGK